MRPAHRRLTPLQFCLLKPIRHSHFSVHRRGVSKVLPGPFASTQSTSQPPETEMTVGHRRAHTELMGKAERLAVVLLGHLHVKSLRSGREFGEQPVCTCLKPAFAAASCWHRGHFMRTVPRRIGVFRLRYAETLT